MSGLSAWCNPQQNAGPGTGSRYASNLKYNLITSLLQSVLLARQVCRYSRYGPASDPGDPQVILPLQLQDWERDDRHHGYWDHHHVVHLLPQHIQHSDQQAGFQ